MVCDSARREIYRTEVQNPRRKMQVALLAEPKTPVESSVFVYEHYLGAGITQCTAYTEFQALPVTHACIISLPCTRAIMNAENEPVSCVLVSMAELELLYSKWSHY